MALPLEQEFQYFRDHQDELVRKYRGRFVVIKGDEVIGDYADDLKAVTETEKVHEPGTFLVQKAEPGERGYTQTYHSRVVVA